MWFGFVVWFGLAWCANATICEHYYLRMLFANAICERYLRTLLFANDLASGYTTEAVIYANNCLRCK